MQVPLNMTNFRVSVPPLYRWHRSLRRAVWTTAVIVVATIYLLLGIGLVGGLTLALSALVQ